MSSRSLRAQRKGVVAMKHGFDGKALVAALRGPWLVTDDADMTEEEAEASFTLPDGGGVDPKQPWKLPEETGQ